MKPAPAYSLGVVLLAAGRSHRMGRPKLLLPWGETSVLGHLLAQWRALQARQLAVVCAAGDAVVAGELDRLGFPAAGRIANPEPERGMFSSIQCAARWGGWDQTLTHWAILLGDQPHLREATLRAVLDASAAQPEAVCQPSYRGHPRHPVVLPRSEFDRLAVTSAADLKAFLGSCAVALVEVDDPGLELDLDWAEDYERARRLNIPGPV